MATSKQVASILSKISSSAAGLGGALTPFSGPLGIALAIAGAATGIAADIVGAGVAPAERAQDPDALLDAMHAHWQAQRAAQGTTAARPS